MRLALIADAYPPMRSSGAVQISDLAQELVADGHAVTVFIPRPGQRRKWEMALTGRVQVCSLQAPPVKDIGYIRRTLNEFRMPYAMIRHLRQSPVDPSQFDGVVWYSPSIFFAPLIAYLKRRSRCRTYLILRDIFPQWAFDMGLLRRGPAFWLLEAVAARQYRCADVIGVQSPGNLPFFSARPRAGPRRVEVLHNWLRAQPARGCRIDVQATALHGRKVFVYAGNMGIAQGMDALLDLAEGTLDRVDIGYLLVGRGSEVPRLSDAIRERKLSNVVIHDEIEPGDIPGLFAQACAGLVLLDARHVSHNIPGKFVAYMHSGLPVLACVDPASDLAVLIQHEGVGYCVDPASEGLRDTAIALAETAMAEPGMRDRCRALAARIFSADSAASQIVAALRPEA